MARTARQRAIPAERFNAAERFDAVADGIAGDTLSRYPGRIRTAAQQCRKELPR